MSSWIGDRFSFLKTFSTSAGGLLAIFFFLDPRIHGSSKIRTDPRRIRIDPGFGGFVLPLCIVASLLAPDRVHVRCVARSLRSCLQLSHVARGRLHSNRNRAALLERHCAWFRE